MGIFKYLTLSYKYSLSEDIWVVTSNRDTCFHSTCAELRVGS